MKISNNCIDLITKFEGFSSKVYKCPAGRFTIGFGSTFYADGKPVGEKDKPITKAQGEELLLSTLKTYEECVSYLVKRPLTQNQFDSLVSFAYNVGCGSFKMSTLRKLINIDPNNPLIEEQFLKWCRSNGKVLKGLLNRREAESALYFKPN